jgi:hypothetical protein
MAIFIGNVPMAEKIWKIHSDCAKSQRDETEFPFIVSDNLENMPEVIPVFRISNLSLKRCTGYNLYGKSFRGTGLNKHKYLLCTCIVQF